MSVVVYNDTFFTLHQILKAVYGVPLRGEHVRNYFPWMLEPIEEAITIRKTGRMERTYEWTVPTWLRNLVSHSP